MNPSYHFSPYMLPMLASGVFTAALLIYAWRRRSVPGATPFAVFLFFMTLWSFGATLEQAAVDLPTKIFWLEFQVVWQLPGITTRLWFALEYANLTRWLTRRTLGLLAIPPLLALALILTNDVHHLIWLGFSLEGYVHGLTGIGGWILIGYGYLLGLGCLLAFIWLFIQSPLHRIPAMLFLAGTLMEMAVYLLERLNLNPVAPMNSSVLAQAFASALYALAFFRFHLFDVLPVARETVINQMHEGMLVLDSQRHIVDLNPAAEEILGGAARHIRGQSLSQVLATDLDVGAHLNDSTVTQTEITFETAGAARIYSAYFSRILDQRGLMLGHLVLLRDITEQKQAQTQLLEQQRVVATLQEREHLARELHDGLAQMLAAAHLQASSAKRLFAQGANAQMSELLDGLTEMTLEMEAEVREHLLGVKTFFSGDQGFFAALRQYLVRFSQQCDLPIELTVPPELEEQGFTQTVQAQLSRIIQEALSNIRKHAHANCAKISFAIRGSQAQIVIADDGKGFDLATHASQARGFGLQSMRERAETVGGNLKVISSSGHGTQVIVQVPLPVNGKTKI